MRITALAFGVLAGLVASLILALGGLDVSPAVSGNERQAQLIRFGLFVISNLGFLGGALALAVPLAGGGLLVAAALAWAAAALLLNATSGLVLLAPPLLLLLAAIPAFIAHFRPSRRAPAPEPEIIAPMRRARPVEDDYDEDDPDVGMPNFGEPPRRFADPPPRASAANFSPRDHERPRSSDDDWNPGRRRTVPPRARPAFRPVEEDDEPSGFARFALGASSLLSFGLYAVLAGAALLAFWTFRDQFTGETSPTVATAEISSEAPPPASSEPVLAPVLQEPAPAATTTTPPSRLPAIGGGAARQAPAPGTPAAAAAAVTSSAPAPAVDQPEPQPGPEDNFGDVVMSDDPLAPPRLVESDGLPFGDAPGGQPAAAPVESTAEPEPAPVEPLVASTPTIGSMMPRTPTGQMAAMRMARGTGPTIVNRSPAAPSSDPGL